MKKILLFAIAVSFASIAFAEHPAWYCIKFTPPEWSENLLGCRSCPVKDSHGNLITCETSEHPKGCCWEKYSDKVPCTTDYLLGYYPQDPRCERLFEGHYPYEWNPNNHRRNRDGKSSSATPLKTEKKSSKVKPVKNTKVAKDEKPVNGNKAVKAAQSQKAV